MFRTFSFAVYMYYRIRLGYTQYSASIPVTYRNPNIELIIYPNPSSDVVNLWIRNDRKEPYELFIYNLQGIKVYAVQSIQDEHVLTRAFIGSGNFYFTVRFKSGKTVFHRFILQ